MNTRKILFFTLLVITLAAIPITLFLARQQQDIRQEAAGSATLSFTPSTTSTSPLQKNLDDIFTLDVMVNPGDNKVSLVRYEVTFNSPTLELSGSSPVTINSAAFPASLEGPIISGGKISGTVSIGSDYTKAITTPTKVLTIRFKAGRTTTGGPTQVSYTTTSQILSVGSNDQASENVLSSTVPAYITILAPTPTPTACQVPVATGLGKITGNTVDKCEKIVWNWAPAPGATEYVITLNNVQKYKGPGTPCSFDSSKLCYTIENVTPGTYTDCLQSGNSCGLSTPSCGTSVVGACPLPTSTPTPTMTPPTLTLTANPSSIPYNGSSTLTWTSTNATSCTASNGWTGTKTTSGTQATGNLTSNKTYTLVCTGPGGSITKSVAVTVGPAPTATPVPTNTPVPTATPIPQATKLNVTVFMHGIGNSGDNANPTAYSMSNKNPIHQQRTVTVDVLNSNGDTILSKSGLVSYNSTNGNFTGTIDMGTTLQSGVYNFKVKSHQYLKRLVSGIQTITAGQTHALPAITLVTGDINGDNALNILDYNIIVGCYSDFAPAVSCTDTLKIDADLTDDGKVNQFDYNLFLRDLSVQNGD